MMWSNYVKGTLQALMKTHPEIKGANFVVTGNVPQGAGLSSSASFEIAILKAFKELYQLDLDGVKAALIGQQAQLTSVLQGCLRLACLPSARRRAPPANSALLFAVY